jgi:hypothetical protein
MTRRLVQLGGAGCGLFALLLLTNTVSVQERPPLPDTTPQWRVAARDIAATAQPAVPIDPFQEQLFAAADRAAHDSLADLRREWKSNATSESDFLYEGLDGQRFITITTARVDCVLVDKTLARRNSPETGRPDRCARWREETKQRMSKLGIADRTPEQFLQELGVDTSVRVMLVYTGWERDPAADQGVRMITTRGVPLYPQAAFPEADYSARDQIYRAMQLGPYAVEKGTTLASADVL